MNALKWTLTVVLVCWMLVTASYMGKMAWRTYHAEKENRANGWKNIGPLWYNSDPTKPFKRP